MSDSRAKAMNFKESIETKIRGIIEEFAEGKLSREQFHVIYEKYNAQLEIANHALMSGNPDAVSIAQGGPPTIAIRDAYQGKAMGLLIYHNKSGQVLETLGDFTVPVSSISPVLNDLTRLMMDGKYIDRRQLKIGEKQWLMFAAGTYTTVVTEFMHQPSEFQSKEIERLHHDFEEANRPLLEKEQINTGKLAYPFLVFVRKKAK